MPGANWPSSIAQSKREKERKFTITFFHCQTRTPNVKGLFGEQKAPAMLSDRCTCHKHDLTKTPIKAFFKVVCWWVAWVALVGCFGGLLFLTLSPWDGKVGLISIFIYLTARTQESILRCSSASKVSYEHARYVYPPSTK